MGNISGSVYAKCKSCDCVFVWHVDSVPFVDSEIVGTCGKCLNREGHDCVDESYERTKVIGHKVFKGGSNV